MPLHDINYKHWEGVHLGVWERRWVIAKNGLTACIQNKWMWNIIVLCWGLALVGTAFLFVVGQLLVPDSVVVKWVSTFNPSFQNFFNMLISWLNDHPEISVGVTQNVLFYFFCSFLMRVSIFALGLAIPLLITRDLASNAIIIYSSKAVSRFDYLLGKFTVAFGLLTLTWLGPVCATWFVGNLLAPHWQFFWHARGALGNILIYGLTSMAILSILALGVSSTGAKEKATMALWFTWWILGGVIQPIALHTKPWLQHLGLNFNFTEIALFTFRPGEKINTAKESIPILSNLLPTGNDVMSTLDTPKITGAALALAVMLAAAAWMIHKRVKPE